MMVSKKTKFFQKSFFRLFFYIPFLAVFIFFLHLSFIDDGEKVFYENAVAENVQNLLLVVCAVLFYLQSTKHTELRAIFLILVFGCLLAICRELDFVIFEDFSIFFKIFDVLFSISAMIYVYIKRKSIWYALSTLLYFPAFWILGLSIVILLPLVETIGYNLVNFGSTPKVNRDIPLEETIEAICYFLVLLSTVELRFLHFNILDKLYEKFGKDIVYKVLSKKKDKIVYNMTTKKGEFILIIIPHITATRFYKYMSSQGLQQQLFLDGMDAVEIPYAYIEGDNVVSVHRRFIGSDNFADEKEFLAVSGRTYGKLHRITMNPKYKKTFMLLDYPNVLVRAYMFVRYVLNRQVSQYIKYYKLRKFPWGICHRDNNGKNVLIDEKGNTVLLDFDKHRYMPLVEGLIYFYRKHLKDKSMFNIFLEAYEKERPLTKEEREYLNKTLNIKV